MKLYFRAHRAGLALILSCAVASLTWGLAGHPPALPPFFEGRAGSLDAGVLVASSWGVLVATTFGGPALRFEYGSRRSVLAYDLGLGAAIGLPVLAIAGLAAGLGDPTFALLLIRNAAAIVGVALVLLTYLGPTAASVVPIGYGLAAGLLGAEPDGSTPGWAFLRGETTAVSTVVGLGVFLVGLLTFHGAARIRAARRSTARTRPASGKGQLSTAPDR